MAKVNGKCPVCGALIHVNDERALGHCGKCGAEINVQQSIQLLGEQPTPAAQETPDAVPSPARNPQRQLRREARTQSAAQRSSAADAEKTVQEMFLFCSNEQDFLMLRSKIMGLDVTDHEKAALLAALDTATKERLKDMMEKAKKYEENQVSPGTLLLGCVVIVGGCFFLNPIAGLAALAFCAIGLIGNMSERHDQKKLADGQYAAQLIQQYRDLGYKI